MGGRSDPSNRFGKPAKKIRSSQQGLTFKSGIRVDIVGRWEEQIRRPDHHPRNSTDEQLACGQVQDPTTLANWNPQY